MGPKTKQFTVRDLMQRNVFTAQPNQTIFSISILMASKNIGALPIVQEDGTFIGIITDRDFATKIAAYGCPLDTPVGRIASMPLQTIGPNESILDAAKKMSSKKIRKLVVVKDSKVIGIITSTDLINRLSTVK